MMMVVVDVHAQSSPAAISMDNAIKQLASMSNPGVPGSRLNSGESFVNYHGEQEPPKGSRLLFEDWPKGFVLGIYDTVLKNPNLFLNYDKINHNLYFTFDGKTIIKVETDQARELHFEDSGMHTVLTRVDGIDPHAFFQRLSDSAGVSHYVLYRLLKTQFRRANYVTDGLVSHGNNYDEYVDSYEYYLVMPGAREYAPLSLKKKTIRAAIGHKADEWFAANRRDKLEESDLTDLVNRLNNH
jgi:hypothetical protein